MRVDSLPQIYKMNTLRLFIFMEVKTELEIAGLSRHKVTELGNIGGQVYPRQSSCSVHTLNPCTEMIGFKELRKLTSK